jgi:alpha-beta hydrolase superfamily lysophospholipase
VREVLRVATADGALLAMTHVRAARPSDDAALLLHGFGQNRYLLDLPGRSLAEYLTRAGLHAYVLELRGHGRSRRRGGPYARSIADYADLDLPAATAAVRARGARRLFLVGHSLGGVTCMAAPRKVLSSVDGVVVIASPTHLGRGALRTRLFAAAGEQLLAAVQLGLPRLRFVPTELVAAVLATGLPVFQAPLPLPMRLWEPGQIEPEILRPYLAAGFDREAAGIVRDLARWSRRRSFDRAPGRECVRERLRSFPAPILFIAGAQDRLVPPSSVRPGFEGTGAPRKAWRVYGCRGHRGRYGHVDLILGRHAPHEVWPDVVSFLGRGTG